MVACLSVGVPIWIQNGYKFWISGATDAGLTGNHAFTRKKEVLPFPYLRLWFYLLVVILKNVGLPSPVGSSL